MGWACIATFGVAIKPERQKYQSDINALNVYDTGRERLEYNVKRNYSTKILLKCLLSA